MGKMRVEVDGLDEFTDATERLRRELPDVAKTSAENAAEMVYKDARPRVVVGRTGRASGSLKLKGDRVEAGGSRAPYYGWLDFGGRAGRRRTNRRPYQPRGRYIYRSFFDLKGKDKFLDGAEDELEQAANRAGLEVS